MEDSGVDLKELIAILRRQSRLIIITSILVFLPAFTYLMLATPMYRATALLSIDAGGSNILDPDSIQNSQSAILNSRVDGEVEILRADATVMAVVEKAELLQDPEFGPSLGLMNKVSIALGLEGAGNKIKRILGLRVNETPSGDALVASTITKLKSAVDIRRRGLTYLISVGIESTDPQRAADISNSYVQTYIDRQVLTKSSGIIAARDVLRRQTETSRAELAQSEDALNSFIDDNLSKLEEESDNVAISALRRQLETAQSSKVANIAILASTRDAAARNDWEAVSTSLNDVALAELAKQRTNLANRLVGASAGTQAALDLKDALEKLDQDLNTKLIEAQIAVDVQLTSITDAETVAREQLRDALLQSDMSSAVVADLFNLQQSATIARNQYQQLLARVQNLNALANIQIADARMVSEALAPTNPSSPNGRLIIALAIVVAVGLGVLVALLNEYYIGGVTSTAQLSNLIQARAPVAVPALGEGKSDRLLADDIVVAPLSQYSESFRKIRMAADTSIQQGLSQRPDSEKFLGKGQVILICSALPGEGKSTSAIALARTYAISGLKTFLVDCDLRKPSVAEYLQEPPSSGLINYLINADIDPDLTVTPIKDPLTSLSIITAGSRSTRPTDQLINSARFTSLIDALRDHSDIIVIDSPPLLPVVDTRYLAQKADCAVLVVRASNTTQGEARDAATQMQEVLQPGVSLLGVLNRQSSQSNKRGYYNGAYSGYYGEGS